MKLVVMLSWFDEDPQWLRDCILSLGPLEPDCIICCDGPYFYFPTNQVSSPGDNYDAIIESCAEIGASCNIHTPRRKWIKNEVGKRSFMLERALEVAGPNDWLMVVDTDYQVKRCSEIIREALWFTDKQAAEVGFYEGRTGEGIPSIHRARLLMRANPSLHMDRNHYTYLFDGGHHHILGRDSTLPALDLTEELVVQHRTYRRPEERRAAQAKWYEERDEKGLES